MNSEKKRKHKRKDLKQSGPPCVFPDSEVEETSLSAWKIHDLGKAALQNFIKGASNRFPSRGIRFHNPAEFDRWVLLYLPEASLDELPVLKQKFNVHKPVHVGEENGRHSVLGEVWRIMPNSRQKKAEKLKAKSLVAGDQFDKEDYQCTLESLCLPKEDLPKLDFPQTGVQLDKIEGSHEGYAIDCEMCLSGTKKVLTRVAIVRFSDSKVVLDKLVKPDMPITDYVTQFSGITKEMLADVTYTLADVQQWLRENIGRTDILIGHSLDADLNALEIKFDRIVDTTVLFPHVKGPPFRSSLKYLAQKFLDWEIQKVEVNGHNPVEDARACERLVRLILINGPSFGDEVLRLKAFSTYLSENSAKTIIIGPRIPEFDANGTADHIVCADPQQCIDATLKAAASTSQAICCTLEKSPDRNSQIAYLMENLPFETFVTAIAGTGEIHKPAVRALQDKRMKYRQLYRQEKWDEIENPWTIEDDNKLKEVTSRCKRCDLFVTSIVDPSELQNLPTNIRELYDNSWEQQTSSESGSHFSEVD